MAVDSTGDCGIYFYSHKPRIDTDYSWEAVDGISVRYPEDLFPLDDTNPVVKFNPDVHWTDSLVCRNES